MQKFISSILKVLRVGSGQQTNGDLIGRRSSSSVVGAGPAVTEARQVAAFKNIEVHGSVNVKVFVVEGSSGSVKVQAQENILPIVRTEVRGDTLNIRTEDSYQTTSDVEITIEMPTLAAVAASGSTNVRLHNVASKELRLDVSGSAEFTAKGKVEKLTLDIAGSVGMDLGKMVCAHLSADVSGSAHVQAHVTTSLDLDVGGAVSIVITGKPKLRTVNASGSADVIFL